jgi:hypothetical protein
LPAAGRRTAAGAATATGEEGPDEKRQDKGKQKGADPQAETLGLLDHEGGGASQIVEHFVEKVVAE